MYIKEKILLKYIYVANAGDSTSSVINIATNNTVTATVLVGKNPVGVPISPYGTTVYLANSDDNTVSVINSATNTVLATLCLSETSLMQFQSARMEQV